MPARILIAKPGLDGHDRGAKLIARVLRDAGFEVIYLGLRQQPETIAAVAVQEDVDVVGLSILSGTHVAYTRKTIDALRAAGAHDVALVVGGTIPQRDVPLLEAAGAAGVFPTGAALETVVERIQALTLGWQPVPETYRVVQWATGTIGSRALREVIRNPRLDLVGVLVTNPAKEGQDAGSLCGEPPTGVLATRELKDVLALAPDCVLYMPLAFSLDDVVAVLEAGINVVTTRGELIDGGSPLGDEGRQRVLDACRAGGSSAYATGSSPGFVTEVLPLALLTLQRTVESVSIQEFGDLSQRPSPELIFELMGFGKSPETFNPGRAAHLMSEFAPSMRTIADAAGIVIDGWTATGEVAVTRQATTIVAGELAAGTVGAQRMSIIGSAGGAQVLRFTANWYCTTDLEPAWDLAPTGWRLQVRGDSSMDVDVRFPVPVEDLAAVTPAYTATRPVNAVPYVCQAAPGILQTVDLPPMTPAGPNVSARRRIEVSPL